MTTELDRLLSQIAAEHLRILTLVTRGRDSLDFHEVAVWQLKAALKAAFEAARAECAEVGREANDG